ncbi:MAG: hypothetical protein R3185_05165, partial [Candidatus Thermoplasmatota archaeon]|nr:hypothetical protein [Candidatus Thermoplasmatota archaeon]
GPGYVPKVRVSAEEAIRAVRGAGGVAVLAHPCFIRGDHLVPMLEALVPMGLGGLEVWYSRHSEAATARFDALAQRYRLARTGGSDFHGENKPDLSVGTGEGDLRVPYAAVEELQRRARP